MIYGTKISTTKAEIENGLIRLGLTAGMMLEVHCSLSSFGHVEGGAETVIYALKNTIGTSGAILMPSFKLSPDLPLNDTDRKLGLTQKIRILQDDQDKSAMGIVSDTFRKMPDVITGEGLFRISAWGKDAEKHASLVFQHLIDSNGHALLIGVDIYRMSTMHYVENSMPDEIKNRFIPPEEARTIYPESEWFIEAWAPPVKAWYTIQDKAYENGYIADTMIGNSKCMLVKVKMVTDLYRSALHTDPFRLYGLI